MNNIETMKLALEALEYASTGNRRPELITPAIIALRQAIDQADQAQPVAWYEHQPEHDAWFLAYSKNPNPTIKTRPLVFGDTAPPRQPLTDEQITEHFEEHVDTGSLLSFADGVRFAEAAHGIKAAA